MPHVQKKRFCEVLRKAGLDFCKLIAIKDVKNTISSKQKYFIKPDSLYSGYGIKILNNKNLKELPSIIQQSCFVPDKAKWILQIKTTKANVFEYLKGEEYSVDVFVNKGKYEIIRLCKKIIEIIDDTPCLIGYYLIPCPKEIMSIIFKWISALFNYNDISFAQFDFIITNKEKRIVPIDFSCRLGGGLNNLFKFTSENIYLKTLENSLKAKKHHNKNLVSGYYQLNVTPAQTGKLMDNYSEHFIGKFISLKKKGDIIDRVGPSVHNRIGIILGKTNNYKLLLKEKQKLIVRQNIFNYQQLALYINNACKLISGKNCLNKITKALMKIDNYNDILKIFNNKKHILFPWVPAIIYAIYGLSGYKNCSLNQELTETIIMIHPTFKKPNEIIEYLNCNLPISYEKFIYNYTFSKTLSAKLYGGYPWFTPYYRLCCEMNCFNKTGVFLLIKTQENVDLYRIIENLKDKFRKENPEYCITKKYFDCKLKGVINPFHSPNPIENKLHIEALFEAKL